MLLHLVVLDLVVRFVLRVGRMSRKMSAWERAESPPPGPTFLFCYNTHDVWKSYPVRPWVALCRHGIGLRGLRHRLVQLHAISDPVWDHDVGPDSPFGVDCLGGAVSARVQHRRVGSDGGRVTRADGLGR